MSQGCTIYNPSTSKTDTIDWLYLSIPTDEITVTAKGSYYEIVVNVYLVATYDITFHDSTGGGTLTCYCNGTLQKTITGISATLSGNKTLVGQYTVDYTPASALDTITFKANLDLSKIVGSTSNVAGGPDYSSKSGWHFNQVYGETSIDVSGISLVTNVTPTGVTIVMDNKYGTDSGGERSVSNSTSEITLKLTCTNSSSLTNPRYYFQLRETTQSSSEVSWANSTSNSYKITNLPANHAYIAEGYILDNNNSSYKGSSGTIKVRTRMNQPSVTLNGLSESSRWSTDSTKSKSLTSLTISYTLSNVSTLTYKIGNGSYGSGPTLSSTTYTITGLSENTKYIVYLQGSNADYTNASTASGTYSTGVKPTLSVSCTKTGLEQFTFQATPSRSGKVYWSTDNSNWTLVNTTDSSNAQTITIPSTLSSSNKLTPSTKYTYYFKTKSADGTGGVESTSSTITNTTLAISTISKIESNGFSDGNVTVTYSKPTLDTDNKSWIDVKINTGSGNYTTIHDGSSDLVLSSSKSSITWIPTQDEIDTMYKLFNIKSTSIQLSFVIYTKGVSTTPYSSTTTHSQSITANSIMKTAHVSVNGVMKRAQVWIGDANNVPRRAIVYTGVDDKVKRTI